MDESYRLIPLHGKYGEGKFVKVSPEDFEHLAKSRWVTNLARNGCLYPVRYSRDAHGKTFATWLHKEVCTLAGTVDHRDGDTLNAQRENLRIASHGQNMQNRHSKTGSSRFKGVYLDKRTNKWRAEIRCDGQKICLGSHNLEIDAAQAYDSAAQKHHGLFARLNFSNENSE